jgi:predicted transcriptional regulator
MPAKKNKFKITNREKDVLEILWNSEKPLLASDITKLDPSLSISSVQLALRNLLSKNIIEVADIVYSGTVLSRNYRPTLSREDFLINSFKNFDQKINTQNIVATLLKHEKDEADTINKLEALLKERKQELHQEQKTQTQKKED